MLLEAEEVLKTAGATLPTAAMVECLLGVVVAPRPAATRRSIGVSRRVGGLSFLLAARVTMSATFTRATTRRARRRARAMGGRWEPSEEAEALKKEYRRAKRRRNRWEGNESTAVAGNAAD